MVPTAQILAEYLHKNLLPAAIWDSWHIRPISIYQPTQRKNF